jgi:hypothetical protein
MHWNAASQAPDEAGEVSIAAEARAAFGRDRDEYVGRAGLSLVTGGGCGGGPDKPPRLLS